MISLYRQSLLAGHEVHGGNLLQLDSQERGPQGHERRRPIQSGRAGYVRRDSRRELMTS